RDGVAEGGDAPGERVARPAPVVLGEPPVFVAAFAGRRFGFGGRDGGIGGSLVVGMVGHGGDLEREGRRDRVSDGYLHYRRPRPGFPEESDLPGPFCRNSFPCRSLVPLSPCRHIRHSLSPIVADCRSKACSPWLTGATASASRGLRSVTLL